MMIYVVEVLLLMNKEAFMSDDVGEMKYVLLMKKKIIMMDGWCIMHLLNFWNSGGTNGKYLTAGLNKLLTKEFMMMMMMLVN